MRVHNLAAPYSRKVGIKEEVGHIFHFLANKVKQPISPLAKKSKLAALIFC